MDAAGLQEGGQEFEPELGGFGPEILETLTEGGAGLLVVALRQEGPSDVEDDGGPVLFGLEQLDGPAQVVQRLRIADHRPHPPEFGQDVSQPGPRRRLGQGPLQIAHRRLRSADGDGPPGGGHQALDDVGIAPGRALHQMEGEAFRVGVLVGQELGHPGVEGGPAVGADAAVDGGSDDGVTEVEWLAGGEHAGGRQRVGGDHGRRTVEPGEGGGMAEVSVTAEDRHRLGQFPGVRREP